MKNLLVLLFILVVGCSTSRTPVVCQGNLRFCTSAYEDNKVQWCKDRNNQNCLLEDWDALCLQDLQTCKNQ